MMLDRIRRRLTLGYVGIFALIFVLVGLDAAAGFWRELVGERFPRLSHLWLDAGYNGKGKGKDWVEKALGFTTEVVRPPRRWVWVPEGQEPPPRPAFTVLPRRWVVERTFWWLGQNRRMSKDYEWLPETGEAFIYVAMTRLMARRLARS